MSDYKYFAANYAISSIIEIFRSVTDAPKDFGLGVVWRAKRDGSWSDSEADVGPLLDSWMRGDFDLVDNEITEEQANGYLREWHASGSWPGRD
ncbi:hypothetical protein [Dyella japonica]|uniref:hypothetical protein n=1 Tax=Dyella japonica TaxID=231455 RepID=UPI0012DFEF1F|nr:hypothetical protein [Dyella japonica]